jgi:hypothetical protein
MAKKFYGYVPMDCQRGRTYNSKASNEARIIHTLYRSVDRLGAAGTVSVLNGGKCRVEVRETYHIADKDGVSIEVSRGEFVREMSLRLTNRY